MAIKTLQTRHGPMLAFTGDHYITRCLEARGEYAPGEWAIFDQMVKPGMTVVEAGANIGVHTLPLARKCAPGLLYAFEPQPRVFQALCGSLALNNIGNVLAYPEACGEAEGEAVVPPVDYEAVNNLGGVALQPAQARGQKVRVIALDSLGLTTCGLLKIDVEGFEVQTLKGARQMIARCRPLIYTENDRREHQGELIALLDEMGYRLYWHTPPITDPEVFGQKIVSVNMICVPKERSTQVEGLELIDPKAWRSPLDRR